jgi:V8-like Glu-specific endopeptidase
MKMDEFTIIENKYLKWLADDSPTTLVSNLMLRTPSVPALREMVETTIGRVNRLSISILQKVTRLSNAVALISRADRGRATGFLITPNRLMTNWHVFEKEEQAVGAIARFNYARGEDGKLLPVMDVDILPDKFYYSNQDLDYAVVAVAGNPGAKWGTIPLQPGTVGVKDDVFIIQHPGGQPKEIAMSDNEVKYVDDKVIQYLTDTLPGSSGSPVFNERFEIVGLHHIGGNIEEPKSGLFYFRNEGVRISAIQADMPDLG